MKGGWWRRRRLVIGGSRENLGLDDKKQRSPAGSPRAITTVILQCISSYSVRTAWLDERSQSLPNYKHSNKTPWSQIKQASFVLVFVNAWLTDAAWNWFISTKNSFLSGSIRHNKRNPRFLNSVFWILLKSFHWNDLWPMNLSTQRCFLLHVTLEFYAKNF